MIATIVSSPDPAWYLLAAPITAVGTVVVIWITQKGERRERAEREARLERQLEEDRMQRAIADARISDALFGRVEGATKIKGIVDIVTGNGSGESLEQIARETRDKATVLTNEQKEIKGKVDLIQDAASAANLLAQAATRAVEGATGEMQRQISVVHDRINDTSQQLGHFIGLVTEIRSIVGSRNSDKNDTPSLPSGETER